MEKILTVSDVAKMLQMSPSTIYKYSEKGKIKSFKIGASLRFYENEIAEYLNAIIKSQRNQISGGE
jgi:excisionase family DNA binding protein